VTVAVAHQPSATGHLVLREAAREAALRNISMTVIQVTDAVDLDVTDAHTAGLSDEVSSVLGESGVGSVDWKLELVPGTTDDTAESILHIATRAGAELLVIGARRRSPVGKLILGSVTQTLILEADMPVLVVKATAS